MAIGCRLGKLSGPEAHPGSRLVPGVGEASGGENARKGGIRAGYRREKGGRKLVCVARNGLRTCLKGTQLWSFKVAENPRNLGYRRDLYWVSNRKVERSRKSAKNLRLSRRICGRIRIGVGASLQDFAGIVPSSRGAHCRPLHSRLASLCCGQGKQSRKPGCGLIQLRYFGTG